MTKSQDNSNWGWIALVVIFVCLCLGGLKDDKSNDVDKIIRAKEIIRNQVNYPDTLDFHDMSTTVSGSRVELTFTVDNGFGVPSTHTMEILVEE